MEDTNPTPTNGESQGGHGRGRAGAHGAGHGAGGHDEHQGAPEWLISFADNVTLMMGFFVILLGLNMKPPASGGGGGSGGEGGVSSEVLDWVIGVRAAFNNPVALDSAAPNDRLLVARLVERAGNGAEGLAGSEHDVQSIRPSDVFGEGGRIRFATDSSELTDQARAAVAELAGRFCGYGTVLEIRGHCSVAEGYRHPDRGMSLSQARAFAVAQELAARGIGWERLRLVACADNQRLARTARSEEEQNANQRVEVLQVHEAARPPD